VAEGEASRTGVTMAEFEVPQPIICSPFAEPSRHWLIQEGTEPTLVEGRRPAHYFYRAPGQEAGATEGAPVGDKIDLPLVNLVRERVRQWRMEGYPGVTGTTLELLAGRSTRSSRMPDSVLQFRTSTTVAATTTSQTSSSA